MDIIDNFDCLHFNNDAPFNEKIGNEIADQHAPVADLDSVLLSGLKAVLLKLYKESILIDLFQKASS